MKTFVSFITMDLFQSINDINVLYEQHGFGTLMKYLMHSNDSYHNEGSSPISDAQYDILYDFLKNKDQHHPFFGSSTVGSNVFNHEKTKRTLPIFMGSMNKIKKENR